jgi:hypothetical protein
MLAVQPKYSDDLAHRIEFFQRFFPRDYPNQNRKAREAQQALPPPPPPAASAPAPVAGKADKAPKPAEFPAYTLLDAEAAQAWLRGLNDARIALGIRLEITVDTLLDYELDEAMLQDPSSPRVFQLSVYSYLGYLQDSLLNAITGNGRS